MLPGETAFTLYDTFGFPLDLTADVCRERGFGVDQAGFDAAMDKQRQRARAASTFKSAGGLDYHGDKTVFDGYETLAGDARVVSLYRGGSAVESLASGEDGIVVLDRTPFYAESGGQVGDRGEISKSGTCLAVRGGRHAEDRPMCSAPRHGQGRLRVGDTVRRAVDRNSRERAARNRLATHLMRRAAPSAPSTSLKGSLVDAQLALRLRASAAMMWRTDPHRRSLVNREIRAHAER